MSALLGTNQGPGKPEIFKGVWSYPVWTTGRPRASHSGCSHRLLGLGTRQRISELGRAPRLLQGKGHLLRPPRPYQAFVPLLPSEAILGQRQRYGIRF